MSNWKIHEKVTLYNCGFVIIAGLIVASINASDGFGFALGLVCLAGGLIDFVIGIILSIAGQKDWARGFLLSTGILLLLSGISCGTGLSGANFH